SPFSARFITLPSAAAPPAGARAPWNSQDPVDASRELWQSQAPFLYDFLAVQRLTAVSALAWPGGAAQVCAHSCVHRLVVGSVGSLRLLAVALPLAGAGRAPLGSDVDPLQPPEAKVTLTHAVPHEGPVARVACSPHRTLLLAAASARGVALFDACRWSAGADAARGPDLVLRAPHAVAASPRQAAAADLGLAWSPEREAHVLAALPSGGVGLWDAAAAALVAEFPGHGGPPVPDLAASAAQPGVVASCGADGRVCLLDTRAGAAGRAPVWAAEAHEGGCRCVSFGPPGHAAALLASGGQDGAVRLWDARRAAAPCRALCPGRGPGGGPRGVARLAWSGFDEGVLASADEEGRVCVWSVCDGGEAAECGEGPQGLLCVHGGHLGAGPVALAWSPDVPWLLASGAVPTGAPPGQGELHLWRPLGALG
ncbi:unnamed protein product, partial [Prorocentrum cordatum]